MKRHIFRVSIIAFWVVMTAWLVRYEAFPEYFTNSLAGYRSLLSEEVLLEDSWMRILFNGTPIGYSHSSLEVDETNPLEHYAVSGSVHLKLHVLGTEQRMHIDSAAAIDVSCRLQSFTFKLVSDSYTLRLGAARMEGNTFDVRMHTSAGSRNFEIEVPDDVIVYSPMTDMALRKLEPGRQLSIKTLDPVSMATVGITVKALRRERLALDGVEHDATVLATEYGGGSVLSWIDGEGVTLRQETPFGWVMERCSAEDAFQTLRSAGLADDMTARLAVRCERPPANPRDCSSLKLRLSGVRFSRNELATHRQTLVELSDTQAVLVVHAERDAPGGDKRSGEEPVTNFLVSTTFVQADHPDMVARAAAITEAMSSPMEQALAIFRWVHSNVKKEMTVSVPSALDVLKTLAGDCNEHTYLFVGLARAAGLPAKIMVGLAYQDGAFYYHAWPAVYVGRWMEMDPTWGQEGVDATHLALVEGELANQIQLMKVFGQLRIDVLEERMSRESAAGRRPQSEASP